MEQLEGKILSVIFRNDENGYTVLNIDTEDGETVCVGSCFPVRPGESVKLSGGYVTQSMADSLNLKLLRQGALSEIPV